METTLVVTRSLLSCLLLLVGCTPLLVPPTPTMTPALVPLATAIATAATVPGATEGPRTDLGDTATYTDSEIGFAFDYPADWTMEALDKDRGFALASVDAHNNLDPRVGMLAFMGSVAPLPANTTADAWLKTQIADVEETMERIMPGASRISERWTLADGAPVAFTLFKNDVKCVGYEYAVFGGNTLFFGGSSVEHPDECEALFYTIAHTLRIADK